MKRNRNFVNELLRDLRNTSRYLNEAYDFEDEDMPMDRDMDPDMMDMPMERGQQGGDGQSEEEKAMHAQEVVQHEPIIGEIREAAINGLRKYADHPTSPAYAFFKKVFLEADKVLTDNGNK